MTNSQLTRAQEAHYLRLPLWPDFAFGNDTIDGLVPACRIEGWESFGNSLTEAAHEVPSSEMIYRGQRRHEWQLAATLTRQFDGGAIPQDVADRLLKRFLLAMRGRGVDLQDRSNEIWAFGQHYGLATPLLDWTESPFVAMFFAFADEDSAAETENPSRAIFRLNKAALADLMPELFFEPALGENARLVNQAGLFTVTPSNGDNLVTAIINAVVESGAADPEKPSEIANYLCKIHVPNRDRAACLSVLRKMNIHHASLFPDPSGAARYCNGWLDRVVAEKKREKEAKMLTEPASVRRAPREDASTPQLQAATDVERILRGMIVESDQLTEGQIKNWAARLEKRYNETAAIDWPLHPSTRSAMNVEIKRLLAALGFPKDRRESAVSQIVAHFSKLYAAEHGLPQSAPKRAWPFDFLSEAND